ncbi:MAG: DUF6624 domain-containing protein [Candidatus Woesearchaeota archaeon]
MIDRQLLDELVRRFNHDQQLSREYKADEHKLKELLDNYVGNTLWLKDIIKERGWPSSDLVDIVGEQSAWLIAQHSEDVAFQEECLGYLKALPLTDDRKQYIAYLTDRILVGKGLPQIFGTQFSYGKVWPIEDESGLDVRRKEMCLEPFEEYRRIMER